MLMVSRLGVAVGEAVCAPTGTSWIGDLVPAGKRARALAFFMLAVPVGTALSYAISGPVAQAFGWRHGADAGGAVRRCCWCRRCSLCGADSGAPPRNVRCRRASTFRRGR